MDKITGFCEHFSQNTNVVLNEIFKNHNNFSVSGCGNSSSKTFVFSKLPISTQKALWIVTTDQEMESTKRLLSFWTTIQVEEFKLLKPKESQFNKEIIRANEVGIMECLTPFFETQPYILIMKYEDLFLKLPGKDAVKKNILHVNVGQTIDSVEFFEQLIYIGYKIADSEYVAKGTYVKKGEVIFIHPVNSIYPIKITLDFDKIEKIETLEEVDSIATKIAKIYPIIIENSTSSAIEYLSKQDIFVEDELEIFEQHFNQFSELITLNADKHRSFQIASFMEDESNHTHLHYLSVLKYQNVLDMVSDLKEKRMFGWKVLLVTKHADEFEKIFEEKKLGFSRRLEDLNRDINSNGEIVIVQIPKEGIFPEAFQTPGEKIELLTDREVIGLKDASEKRTVETKAFSDFLTSLKPNDYIVHQDHGIGVYMGLEKKTIDEITREYLKIGYAENDKLFVPIDQADKVSKYISGEESRPKLTRLGSAEWQTITSKVQKETEIIAKELLDLYAKRAMAKGHTFDRDNDAMDLFERDFPYEETPGQIKAINDVKKDMESGKPMDRLVCGDVGFGKTEVAIRAAFKAVQSKKQVAVIAPITILADQHYKSFVKRMDHYHIRVELMSRFQTQKEQTDILKRLAKGEVDIVIGTHRLLSDDVSFKNLGLLIIDEEQRFGVKQKEQFKKFRSELDILTLTATPIPRTLNISLNGLRDITTITTPPPGRLPVVTEVRKYSNGLIREAIMKEIERNGQVYFLHNRVETIESMADKLRQLVPEAKFVVTHGKLSPNELEERILDFKDGKFDVLVSSTIIENGIDLPNANTLIVNNAEKFGLAQLYQLRGRVGRGKRQAYAYFLYYSERLKLDAKKRLRAIVEASELGAGFQIAMKDLEIRGAGDVLGVSQHGTVNVVGVSHFIRMLNKAVDDLKEGRKTEKLPDDSGEREVTIELPLTAYIPDDYVINSKEKISVYQKLSNADTKAYLEELRNDITEEYGKMPREVINLFTVLYLKMLARDAGIVNVKAENMHKKEKQEIVLQMGAKVKPENIINMLNKVPGWLITGTRLRARTQDLGLDWVKGLEESLIALQGSVKKKS